MMLDRPLPTTMPDGAPAAWLRIASHRARNNIARIYPEMLDYCSMQSGHVHLVPLDELPHILDAIPSYCRGSIRQIRRQPKGSWGLAWKSSVPS